MTNPTPPGPTWNPEQQMYDYPSGQPSAPPEHVFAEQDGRGPWIHEAAPHVGQPYPGHPAPSQPRKSWPARHKVLTSLGVLGILAIAGGIAGSSGSSSNPRTDVAAVPSASPEPEITATESADGVQETTPPPPVEYAPKPADFTLGVKVLDKQCFGSAGCNISYRINFTRIAPTVPRDGTFEVTYSVRGGDAGEVVGTIEVDNGDYSPQEGYTSTASSAKKLTAVVTDVSES